jgi:hypothetical protein
VRDELVQSLASILIHGTFIKVNYQATNQTDLVQLLLEETAYITQNTSASKEDVDFFLNWLFPDVLTC